jgi:hypothetical protein
MSEHDSRIEMLQQDIMDSSLPSAEKDILADDLEYANAINGSKDEVMIGIKRLTLSGIRTKLSLHASIKREIAAHASGCSGKVVTSTVTTEKRSGCLKAELMSALIANMKTAIITVGVVAALVLVSIVWTRQIAEAGGFVKDAATAANN